MFYQLAARSGQIAPGHLFGFKNKLLSLDATVIAGAPRLAPHQSKMRANLAGLLGAPEDRVNLKVTSSVGLGAFGRGEGIASLVVVLLSQAP